MCWCAGVLSIIQYGLEVLNRADTGISLTDAASARSSIGLANISTSRVQCAGPGSHHICMCVCCVVLLNRECGDPFKGLSQQRSSPLAIQVPPPTRELQP